MFSIHNGAKQGFGSSLEISLRFLSFSAHAFITKMNTMVWKSLRNHNVGRSTVIDMTHVLTSILRQAYSGHGRHIQQLRVHVWNIKLLYFYL